MRSTVAAMMPMMMARRRKSGGSPAAAMPMMMALSPDITISIMITLPRAVSAGPLKNSNTLDSNPILTRNT